MEDASPRIVILVSHTPCTPAGPELVELACLIAVLDGRCALTC